jgi:hypothetical protein
VRAENKFHVYFKLCKFPCLDNYFRPDADAGIPTFGKLKLASEISTIKPISWKPYFIVLDAVMDDP